MCFGWVGDEVVVVEVGDEVGELDCARVCRSFCVAAVMTRVVSSAYVYTFEFGTVRMMLFMYSRKKVVDKVLYLGGFRA